MVATDSYDRPLVVRIAPLGDTVLLTGVLRALSTVWGAPCDVVADPKWTDNVLAPLDSVGEVFGLNSRRTPYAVSIEQHHLVRWLRRRGPSPTYIIDSHRKMTVLVDRGGVPGDLVVSSLDTPQRPLEHHFEFLTRLTSTVPPGVSGRPVARFPDPVPTPELAVDQDDVDVSKEWLRAHQWRGEPVVLIQTLSRRANRGRWPEANWVAAIGHVLRRLGDVRVVLIGAPNESEKISSIAARFDDARVTTTGRWASLGRLFALISLAHSMISLDTGPAHVAAALGCPVVVLAGSNHIREYRPLAPPERARIVATIPENAWPEERSEFEKFNSTAAISVGQVVDAWEEIRAEVDRGCLSR